MEHHGQGLSRLLRHETTDRRETELQALRTVPLPFDDLANILPRADLALLRYAEKLTQAPQEISASDIDALRQEGFDDRAIHDACAITAYFAFVNRMADGLGVELETGD